MTINSFSTRELRWFIKAHLAKGSQPSQPLLSWLLDKSSLTTKLVKLSKGNFKVKVLRQIRTRASRSEAQALGISRHSIVLVREVLLMGNHQPWVFARSLLPLSSLNGSLRHLRKQGTRPLGAFLFSQPHLQRGAIALAQISQHHAYVPPTLLDNVAVWGRRSVFYIDSKPLLVSEVFLPSFPAVVADRSPLR